MHRPKGGNKSSGCCDTPELQLTGLILSADAVSAGMPATVLKTHAKCFDVTTRHAWHVKTLSLFRNTDVTPGNRRRSNRCCSARCAQLIRLAGRCRASYCDDSDFRPPSPACQHRFDEKCYRQIHRHQEHAVAYTSLCVSTCPNGERSTRKYASKAPCIPLESA